MPTGLLSPSHIAILVLVLLIIYGPKRLPEMGRSLGKGLREFKDSVTGQDDDEPVARRELPATSVSEEPVSAASREHDTI